MSTTNDAGFRTSPVLQGRIDTIQRVDASTINMAGWVAVRNSNGEPFSVLAFANGEKIFPNGYEGRAGNEAAASNVAFMRSRAKN